MSLYKLVFLFVFLGSVASVSEFIAGVSVRTPNSSVYKNSKNDVCVVNYETIEKRKITCMAGIAERIIDALPNIWSTIQNVAIQTGSVVVVAGTTLFTSTSENNNDYTIPQLPGELGDRYELYDRHFIYTKRGWKLASLVTVEDIWEIEDEVSIEIPEPEYAYVEHEGWANNETYWLSTGMRLHKQCCTLGGDNGKTVLYYDLAYDAALTKDLEQKRSEQKRRLEKVKSLSSGGPNGRCLCGHTCFGVCNCDCACGCGKVKNIRNMNKKQRDELNQKNRIENDVQKTEFFNSVRDQYKQVGVTNIYILREGAQPIVAGALYLSWDGNHNEVEVWAGKGRKHLGALDPATKKIYKVADPTRALDF